MNTFFKTILALIVLVLLIVLSRFCSSEKKDSQTSSEAEPEFLGYNIRLVGESPEEFKERLENGLNITLQPDQLYVCPCDTTIVSLQLTGVEIEGHGPAQIKTETGAVGMPFDYGKNYALSSDNDSLTDDAVKSWTATLPARRNDPVPNPFTLQPGENPAASNVVAIFDAGVHQNLAELSYAGVLGVDATSKSDLCGPAISVAPVNGRILGVNHIAETGSVSPVYSDIQDHSMMQHGTKVTQLLAEQRINQTGAGVRILTMRVLNSANKGNLFSLMCAMSQAKKLGARIFNMSLGYYGPPDALFQKQMEQLANDKIWVVTAAGNAMDSFDEGTWGAPENRNLTLRPDTSKFYPAYFSRTMDHVISVTTINGATNDVCDKQNYSPDAVDIGVLTSSCSMNFKAGSQNVNIAGTSYATPIVTGWLALKQNLDSFTGKTALLSDAMTSPGLENKIKGARYIKPNSY